MEKTRIGGVIRRTHLAQIEVLSVPDRPGVAAALLKALGDAHINVQFIVQCIDSENRDHIVLCVDRDDMARAMALVNQVSPQLCAGCIRVNEDVAIVSIFGPDFRERPGIAGQMFDALASENINILAISTSISTVSCVIQNADLQKADQALLRTFELP
ncbi:MAG: ACT domain-containing protein [Chloroflexi bacterium]|nr:ACT domain-containing protein [Chloroflexota bacterium]